MLRIQTLYGSILCLLLGQLGMGESYQIDGRQFQTAAGLEVIVAAGPPLIERPICAAFDERGRLYVAESSGSNDDVQTQLQQRPHRILRLEDLDGDGVFDRRTIYADRMMFPEGTMWRDGSLYVAAPPDIWKLTDVDDDGIADRREVWFAGKTLTGCANDLHGPYLGPDGWIYWCKGAFAQQTYERPGRSPLITRAAHIFRRRPEGGPIEPVMTGGMDNPVDVVFTAEGERVFTTTFLQHPRNGQRDGLIHAIYGGVYGKVHAVIDDHPQTGPVMPVLTHLGPAAPCGLERLTSEQLGPDYAGNLLTCQFNLHKVSRHILRPHGATFHTEDSDLLRTDDIDFHPTDVLEDADGSVLVVDTGGWYKLCCPTSQLWKPDVLGAIYRLRRRGGHAVEDPRGNRLSWQKADPATLIERMLDKRHGVRQRAADQLAQQGAKAVPRLHQLLRSDAAPSVRQQAIWCLCRIDHDAARRAVRDGLQDADPAVRQAALHAVSVWRDQAAAEQLIALLQSSDAPNRRAAAEALGRVGDRQAVAPLLAAAASATDRVLQHSIIYALMEIGQVEATRQGLQDPRIPVQQAALIALDQMPGRPLQPGEVISRLTSQEPRLRETLYWIVARRKAWAPQLATVLFARLNDRQVAAPERRELQPLLVLLAEHDSLHPRFAAAVLNPELAAADRRLLLDVMAQSSLAALPSSWCDAICQILAQPDPSLSPAALTVAASLPPPQDAADQQQLARVLEHIVGDASRSAEIRLQAAALETGERRALEEERFRLAVNHLLPEQPVSLRTRAATILSRAALSDQQLTELSHVMPSIGPLEINQVVQAFAHSRTPEVGHQLLEGLRQAEALHGLRPDTLDQILAHYGPAVQQDAASLYEQLNIDVASQRQRLETFLATLPTGDARRGLAVFHSSKAACASCHTMGYVGGTIGPDLTRIGKIRTRRDLLESILFPSLSFVRSYEPFVATTDQGQSYSGILKEEGRDELVLVTADRQEIRIVRQRVEQLVPGRISIMPAGLETQLSPQELADLLEFLQQAR